MKMKWQRERNITCLLNLFAIGISGHLSANSLKKETRPNVLLVMADDQGYRDYGLSGNPYLPNTEITLASIRILRDYDTNVILCVFYFQLFFL